jgi:hypothetical protein
MQAKSRDSQPQQPQILFIEDQRCQQDVGNESTGYALPSRKRDKPSARRTKLNPKLVLLVDG